MIFYKELNKRLDEESYIMLEDDDVDELKSILTFYSNTKRNLNELTSK